MMSASIVYTLERAAELVCDLLSPPIVKQTEAVQRPYPAISFHQNQSSQYLGSEAAALERRFDGDRDLSGPVGYLLMQFADGAQCTAHEAAQNDHAAQGGCRYGPR